MHGFIQDYNKVAKAFMFIGLILIVGTLFSLLGKFLGELIYGISITNQILLENKNVVYALRIMQIFGAIGTFIIPSWLFVWLNGGVFYEVVQLKKQLNINSLGFTLLSIVAITPFVFWINDWNQGVSLPDSMHGIEAFMKEKEKTAELVISAFLGLNTIPDFILNLIMIGFCAAIGEELVFRGLIQKWGIRLFKSEHIGIWVAAILFSAIHVQFYGFFPRMILGALFGYVYLYSKNLWMPIIAHFLHNSMQLVLMSLYYNGKINFDIDKVEPIPIEYAMVSLVFSGAIMYAFFKFSNLKVLNE